MMIARLILTLPLLAWVSLAPPGSVSEVRISSAGNETEIAILTRGDVELRDFMLDDPPRLIVDVRGAVEALPLASYEGIGRGGVVGLRSSRFRADVVRLVFDLAIEPEYVVDQVDGLFVIRFPNPGRAFDSWTSGSTGTPVAMDDRVPEPTSSHVVGPLGGSPSLAAVAAARSALSAVQEQPRISVSYDSATMLDVLAGFSEFAGISIVPSAAAAALMVRGVDIRNQQWDQALDAILSAQGLGWRRQSEGILIVDLLEGLRTRDTLLTETRVLRINYASADSVAATLRQLATPNRGQVVAYQGANSVIITDVPSVVSRMDSLVRILDRKTPQVSINAKIIFVDRTDINELGITYDLKDLNGNSINRLIAVPDPLNPGELTNETLVDLGGNSIAALANANDRVIRPALEILTSVAFGNYSLSVFIDALEQKSLSDVQAAPSVQVIDNHPARIQVGEETPLRVLEAGAQLENATANVEFKETGIILEVTPHITNNNQILLDLRAERSGVEAGPSDLGFIFKTQNAEARLLVNDGETAVIGGLTLSEVTRSESGIPGLMNLPLIGALFRTTKTREVKQDLLILVTPHIIDD
jgi:type IV pilus assembly protein PilQ